MISVISDKYLIHKNPMFQMSKEANSFMKEVYSSDYGNRLTEKFSWLKYFNDSINENC